MKVWCIGQFVSSGVPRHDIGAKESEEICIQHRRHGTSYRSSETDLASPSLGRSARTTGIFDHSVIGVARGQTSRNALHPPARHRGRLRRIAGEPTHSEDDT
ncbi:hypothetical protein GCM10027068_16800 [Prescottella soli]